MTPHTPSQTRLYFETLRRLKSIQLIGRIRHLARIRRPDRRSFTGGIRAQSGPWATPIGRLQSQFGEDVFCFLSVSRRLQDIGWDSPAVDKLWRYNLHYFDDMNAVCANERLAWHQVTMQRWIADNPVGVGSGWEAYPCSLRIVNWVKFAISGRSLDPAAVASLAHQSRWLFRHIEYHLLGNHLFVNAKALIFAGCFFDGEEAERWLCKGRAILKSELKEQILGDGGHFELSPMYHALIVEDLLDLINLTSAYGQQNAPQFDQNLLLKMLAWLEAMCHPDGQISFFNDAALRIAPTLGQLVSYAARLDIEDRPKLSSPILHLPESGYMRVEHNGAVALLDVGEVGPRYLAGHSHADSLSFEMSLFGQRIFVNSGTSLYGISDERRRQRGTAAHNTVTVMAQNSSEVWSGFRTARRAHIVDLEINQDQDINIACSHNGYTRFANGPLHRRRWNFDSHGIVILDELSTQQAPAEAWFHLHPDCKIDMIGGDHSGRITSPSCQDIVWACELGTPAIVASTYHPEFGVTTASYALRITLHNGKSQLRLKWTRA